MPIRFVFVTDSHHYPGAPRDFAAPKMLTQSRAVLEAVAPEINALNPDFIVHGGDVLCGGGAFEIPIPIYLQSIEEAADAFDGFRAPAYYVPGNHDCDPVQGSFEAFASRFPIPETVDVVDAAPRLRLALANIYGGDPIRDGEGVWTDALDRALAEAAEKAQNERCAMLLVLHTWVLPDYEPGDGEAFKGVVTGADRLLETVSAHPAIVAVLTGHRHINRIRMYRDFPVIDTACLIGFPVGFREILLEEDGYCRLRFHQLDLPELIRASFDRSTPEANRRWQGEIHDRETEILLPRLREIWR